MSRFVIPVLALAAAVTATNVRAQESHLLTPHYPDNFKIEITRISDSEQIKQAQDVKMHTKIVMTEAAQRTDAGYRAVFTGLSSDAESHDGQGTPSPQADMQKHILGAITAVGPVEVTLDKDMTPLSVDNIDAIKPRLNQALATPDTTGEHIHFAFIGKLTPQSAAAFLQQMRQVSTGSGYNRVLPMHTPVALPDQPVPFMGTTVPMNGTITLDQWHDGQSASLTTILAPTDTGLREFKTMFAYKMWANFLNGNEDKDQLKSLMDKTIDNTHATLSITCRTTIDLTDFAVARTACDTTSEITVDLAKLQKQPPESATGQPVSVRQIDHTVTESRLIP